MIRSALQQYADERIAPSPFLRAVLENDLNGAYKLHSYDTPGIGVVMKLMVDICPKESYGSVEAVAAWLGETPRKVLK